MSGQWFDLALKQPSGHLAPCFILVKGKEMPCFWSSSGWFLCHDNRRRKAVKMWRYRKTGMAMDELIER